MAEGRIDIDGWLVADVEVTSDFGLFDERGGGRLMLFRTASEWTLLRIPTRTRYDENDHPVEGEAWARAATYASLDELRSDVAADGLEDWRTLVRAGASEPCYDPELIALWTPVQIDQELHKSSVYRRDLGVHGDRRGQDGWREEALGVAVARLQDLGFVVLESAVDHRRVFRRGLGHEWSNPIVGAVVAARLGHRVQLVVAIDGAGEIYARTAETSFTPGERRRYPPQPLTERELDEVEALRRRRRAEALS